MFDMKEYKREYYLRNKDKHKKYYEKYYLKNVKKIREYVKLYYLKNVKKRKEYIKEWNREKKELRNKITKKYREKNVNKIKKQRREYMQTLNGKLSRKASSHSRRLLTKDLTIKVIQQVYENNIKKYNTLTCYLCLKQIEFGQDSLEHIISISKGGSNNIDNLDIAHRKCNSSKGNKTLEEWKQKREVSSVLS